MKRLYVKCKTVPQPLQHAHNNLRLIPNKSATILTTMLGFRQQPHNRSKTLYHNKSTTGSQQDDFIWKPDFKQPLKYVHNKLTIDYQQKHHSVHDKTRIPANNLTTA